MVRHMTVNEIVPGPLLAAAAAAFVLYAVNLRWADRLRIDSLGCSGEEGRSLIESPVESRGLDSGLAPP